MIQPVIITWSNWQWSKEYTPFGPTDITWTGPRSNGPSDLVQGIHWPNDSYTYYGHISWWGQRNYLKWQLFLLWPCFLSRTAKLPEMTAIPIMAIFLEEDRETTWNDSYTYNAHVPWGGQGNYLKWQLYLLWPYSLRRTGKLPEMTAIPIMAIILEEDREITWNDSYTYNGHTSLEGKGNYLKWQLYLLWPCFLRRTSKLLEMTAMPVMSIFLEKDSETLWNDSYTYYGHISWGGQRNYL